MPFRKFQILEALILIFTFKVANILAQTSERKLEIWKGSTPIINGVIAENEYSDAVSFQFDRNWHEEYGTVTDPLEYSLKGWAKHDGTSLFLAFDVTDSILYGFDISRWTPDGNPNINDLTLQNDVPFWGDAIEIFLYTSNTFTSKQEVAGNGYSWNSICNTHKSRLGQLNYGGLIEGYPRDQTTWNRYKNWIENGNIEAKVRIKDPPKTRHLFYFSVYRRV